jgi:serine/threonine-protein kinase
MIPNGRISHYDIAAKLGEGGMGVVYKAWDTKLPRFVALKFLSTHLVDSSEHLARFHQEARAISALNHPNIATIYEVDEAPGYCFIAFEYLPGGTLRSILDQRKAEGQPLSVEQALDYAIDLAEALAHAHKHGVIHRDIKPANMLFSEAGALKVTDFGLAKLVEGAAITQTASIQGTPVAMSPEQAQGLEVDERSDIFSAGVVMFELFGGDLPFRGSNATSVLYQVVHTPAPPLGKLRPGIPVALERIVVKALAKDPAQRYQKAAELAGDLRDFRRLLSGSSAGSSTLAALRVRSALRPRLRLGKAWLMAAALVIAAAALWSWTPLRERGASLVNLLRAHSLPAEKRLAVLPFRNVSGNPSQQAFLDGLVDVVSSKLTRLERAGGSLVVVVSPDEVRAKEISTPGDAVRRLGANLIMTGSLVEAGAKPQVIVSLEDPQTLVVLRSETMEASQPDLAADAETLVRMLEVEVSSGTRQNLQAGDSSNPIATRFYLEGRGYLLRYDRAENLDLAAAAFRDAVAKDPQYALAWAGLAEALWQKYKIQKDPALLNEAASDGERAVQLNSKLAAVHITMGQVKLAQGDSGAAVRELQAALAYEPANAAALRNLGDVYQDVRKDQEAEATYRKAIEVRPADAAGQIYLGRFYFNRNRLPEAELSFRRAIELVPDSYLAHSNLGAVYGRTGRYPEAVEQFEKSVSIAPNALGYRNLGTAFYALKRYNEAAQAYSQAVMLAPGDSFIWASLADAYRWTSDLRDRAPEAYRRAIALVMKEIATTPGDARLRARLAMYSASVGDRPAALSQIGEALKMDASSAYVQYRAALVYEQAGDRARALQALDAALKKGQPLAEVLAAPPLEDLRKDPRFTRMTSPLH